MIKYVYYLILILTTAVYPGTWEIVENSSDGMVLEWSVPVVQFQSVTTSDRDYQLPVCGNLALLSDPGFPQVPVTSLLLQDIQSSQITILDTVFTTVSCGTICPAPFYRETGEEFGPVYETGNVYLQDVFYPSAFVGTDRADMRGHPVLRLAVHPVLVNSARGQMRGLRYIKIRIRGKVKADLDHNRLSGPANAAYKVQSPRTVLESTPWWQGQAGDNVVKIKTTETGVYQVTGRQLEQAGVNVGAIDPSTLYLSNRGTPQPIQLMMNDDQTFGPDDKLLFYAQRLDGDTTWYNAWSDTNIYWLEWGGSAGPRLESATLGEPTGTAVSSFRKTMHFEQDLEYYHGDSDRDIQESFATPGEGWVWSKTFYPGTIKTFDFDLPGFYSGTEGDGAARMRVRLRGMTTDSADPDHHVVFNINGTRVYEGYFNDREELIANFAITPGILLSAANQLEIQSVDDTDADISQFYFDWFEVNYPHDTGAENGELSVDTLATTGAAFSVDGFSSDSIYIWDTEHNRSFSPATTRNGKYLRIMLLSAGLQDGNYALFYLNGELIYQGSRGINLVVINENSGQVELTRAFDTWSSAEEADSLAAVINRIPQGRIVLCAVRDDGSNQLQSGQYSAIESLGSEQIRNLGLHDSWVLAGIRGGGATETSEQLIHADSGPAKIDTRILLPGEGSSYIADFTAPVGADKFLIFDANAPLAPVVEPAVIPDLFGTDNGADYLVITHPDFMEQAVRLADYRANHNGFRVHVVNVNDIYAAFSYGIKTPVAVKAFINYAYHNWQQPAPGYVLLFGDASWDPKFNAETSIKQDFVPVYGNPVTDTWYVCLDGDDDVLPEMHIGRLPVFTNEQAAEIVDKFIVYESTPSAEWKKNFLFISGGFDLYEQLVFNEQSEKLGQDFVAPAPTGGKEMHIRKESEGLDEAGKRDDILNAIDGGVLWTNFIGHAGSSTWDLMFHNPDIDLLQNGPRYPFITSMTCHTGRFAEPNQDSFGERFLLNAEKGAIAFWGTAGWGYTYEDYLYLRQLFPVVLQDTVRQVGKAITLARLGLWNQLGAGEHVRNLLLQYTLLGDPALGLTLPVKPDLSLTTSDIRIDPLVPSESDSLANINILVHNYGLVPQDSLVIAVQTEKRGGENTLQKYTQMLPPVTLLDSLSVPWKLKDMAGVVDVTVQLDPQNTIDEADKNNNQAAKPVTVVSNVIRLLYPQDNALVASGGIKLGIRNPRVPDIRDYMFEFQIDTLASFNSPFFKESGPLPAGVLTTQWQPGTLEPGLYFWRCRNTTESAGTVWVNGSFRVVKGQINGWQQDHPEQFGKDQMVSVDTSGTGVVLSKKTILFDVESAGLEDGNFARILINSVSPLETKRGINMVVFDAGADSVVLARNFDTYADEASPDSLADIISRLADSVYVMCAIMDEGSNQLNDTAYKALEAIGSAECRKLSYRDSWSIIGIKGAMIGSVPEAYSPLGQGNTSVQTTIQSYQRSGRVISGYIGPSQHWNTAEFMAQHTNAATINFNVLGVKATGGQDTLFRNLSPGKADLSSINGTQYPYLVLSANLATLDSKVSPVVKGWSVTHASVSDPAIATDGLVINQDSVLMGSTINFSARIYNIGRAGIDADSLQVALERNAGNGQPVRITQIAVPEPVSPDSFVTISGEWNTSGVSGNNEISLVLDADEKLIDPDRSNNTATATVVIVADTTAPRLDVTFDGDEIMYGDWVSSNPQVQIRVWDNSPESLQDTSGIAIFLDDQRVPFGGASSPLQFVQPDDPEIAIQINYTPQLTEGEHNLAVMVPDPSGNPAFYQESFIVISQLALRNVLNYPNPFTDQTRFTFQMSQPAEVRIRVYTVAGRLILDLTPGWLSGGFNQVPWDGRDADGDIPANGVYLYKIMVNNGTEKAEALGKCIIMK